jgi:hypothetical protein
MALDASPKTQSLRTEHREGRCRAMIVHPQDLRNIAVAHNTSLV